MEIRQSFKYINDNGDNNEKQKILKTCLGIFKEMGGTIPGGNFLGRSFPETVNFVLVDFHTFDEGAPFFVIVKN